MCGGRSCPSLSLGGCLEFRLLIRSMVCYYYPGCIEKYRNTSIYLELIDKSILYLHLTIVIFFIAFKEVDNVVSHFEKGIKGRGQLS